MDMRLKDLAPRRNRPRKRLRRVVEGVLGSLAAALVLFFLADGWLGLRQRIAWRTATAPAAKGDEARQIDAIKSEIGVLLRPRDGAAGIGDDSSGRMIKAAILYARVAELEESRGDQRAADFSMARGVDLLKAANHPNPTEEHLRKAADTLAAGQE